MIPCNNSSEHTLRWKKIFADSIFGHNALSVTLPELDIDEDDLAKIDKLFPIQVAQSTLKHKSDSNINDNPILRQYLPSKLELVNADGYVSDPVGDVIATELPGVIKKYANRVLIIASNTCPIHCRYCFRKNFPYPKENPNTHRFQYALDYCAKDTTINEVILSGGDPLSLEDELIDYLFSAISKIPHITTIRLHTKFPSVIPQRITPELLSTFAESKLNKVCVFHINRPEEITREFCDVVKKIKNTNTITLNQSVLLNGINNCANVLVELSHKLFDAGILPYYLHMLDKVEGTSHFHVTAQQAAAIMQKMKEQLPGYLVPKLAREISGQSSKIY